MPSCGAGFFLLPTRGPQKQLCGPTWSLNTGSWGDFGGFWYHLGSHFGPLWAPGGYCKTIQKRVSVVYFHTLAPSGLVSFPGPFFGGVRLHLFLAFGALLAPLWSPRAPPGTKKGPQLGPQGRTKSSTEWNFCTSHAIYPCTSHA